MHPVFDETNPSRLTLVDILRWRAQHSPQREAYTFLLDGETKQIQMTYADLDHQARRIAALLQERFVPGERVLLLYPPGLEYITAIFGCFYAGAVAVPAYPPRLNQSLMRIQTILQDAQATVALTTSTILSSLHRRFTDETLMQDLLWIATDTMSVGGEQEPRSAVRSVPALRELSPAPEALALLQYTSGSTGSPKGVMLTHTNLMQNAALIQEGVSLTPDTRSVFWLPPYHDMGLMGGILQALYTGYPTVLMAPTAFVQQPLRWLQAISSFRATFSGGPNFAYDLCVKKATPDTIRALDLSSWAVAFNGAEPVRAETLARFAETFADSGFHPLMFYPCYGMAETTLFVSGGQASEMPGIRAFDMQALETGHAVEATGGQELGRPLVSCGYIRQGQEIAIVDPQTCNRLPPGTIGEIWVRSPNVALGYWGKAQETMETFQAFLQDNLEGPFLRTGDLGFCLEEELYVTGRLKNVIIIRGRNLYPQDIEQVVEKSHPLLRQGCCAVFGVESGQARRDRREGSCAPPSLRLPGDKPQPLQVPTSEQLVVVQEVGRHYDDVGVHEAIQKIRQAVLSEFDVEVAAIELLRAGTIFKTTSGKIQRSACRESFLKGELNAVYRWKRAEEPNPLFVWQKKRDEAEAEQAQSTVPTVSGFGRQALTPKVQEIVEWLVRHIAQRAQIDPRIVDLQAPFVQFGLNSLEAVDLSGELEQWLGRSLSPTLIYDYPSIDALACHLAGADLAVGRDRHADGTHPATRMDAIAIIGLGCRFPGANNPEAFWRMLYDSVDGISLVPATRWDVTQFYAPDQATPRKMNTLWGGFLQDIEQFDPAFFRLSPREAEVMDPQQRLLLEVAWEAFEHASLVPERLAGRECGVFIGMSSSDYYALHSRDLDYHQAYTGTGNAHSIAANRLSYFFDFHGPSVAVDTACSSSLFTVHQACQSLRNGECDLALAGGVNVILAPELGVSLSQAHMLSADGRCKTFDADASGYVRSEGCGIVLLKPLADAQRDGDTVLAIIRGSAVNQDGRSNGLTAPNGPSQEAVIRRALQHARVSPNEISYVETHGSSTSLGDPIEVAALRAVLMPERSPDQNCLLGAVKTNIGHLEAAAGIAGLIKTVLCLQKGVIAPNLHFRRLNPHISLAGTTFEIPTEPRPWPGSPDTPRFAGVSAFGFGGTNVHVILEGVPQDEAVEGMQGSAITKPVLDETGTISRRDSGRLLSERSVHLLTLSGRTAQALAVLAQRYQDFLVDHSTTGRDKPQPLRDLCFTANTGRTHFAHRLAVYAENQQQMRERLAAFVAGQPPKEMQVGTVRPGGQVRSGLAFLFTGQGSQYIHMGRQLYETQPTFRQVLDECDHLLQNLYPQDRSLALSLQSVLYPADGATSPLKETAYAQPALFALSYALAQMWLSWGIKPDVVMGHSVGEYVAACVAGVFSLSDGLKLVAARGRLMRSLLEEHGTMAVIEASPERVQSFVAPYEEQVSIAALNGPKNTVISGKEETVQLIVQHLEGEGVWAHLLSVSHAFHSPLIDPMLDAFEQVARSVAFAPLRIPLVCNLTGQLLEAGETLDADYWRRQTREAVQFATGIQTLSAHGYQLFLELGPTPVLSNMGKRCLPANSAIWLSSLHQDHDDWHVLMESIACLYSKGYDLNWSGFYGDSIHHKVALPTYPFEREYCWFKSEETSKGDAGGDRGSRTNKADVKDSYLPLVSQLVSSRKETGDTAHEGTHNEPDAHNGKNVLQTLRDVSEKEHSAILTDYVKAQIATVLRVPAQRLEIEEPLTSLGFDSLMAIELKNRMDLDLQIRLPIMTPLQGPSITQLVQQVLALAPSWIGTVGADRACPCPVPCADPVPTAPSHQPLSHNQKALWFLSRLAPESAAYNMLYAVRIQQCLDIAALQRVLQVLAARYSVLTSLYTLQNGEPVQQTRPDRTIPLEEIDARSTSLDDLKLWLHEESNRPIDLTKGPVLRLKLYRRADDDYVLGFIVHHIVVDFWALELLADELSLLYAIEKTHMAESEGQAQPPGQARPSGLVGSGQARDRWLRSDFQNADYIRWQQFMLQSQEGEQHWQYWQNALAGDLPVLNLPTDRPRPPLQTYKGASHRFSLSTNLAKRLQNTASVEKVTLFTLMLTAYQVLLHRYTHQDDILVGTPALGRSRLELERVIGYLANPVIVRAKVRASPTPTAHDPTFKDLLQQTKHSVLEALGHQDFPFSLLVERLQPQRDSSFSPIFQTSFIWDRSHTHNGEDLTEGLGLLAGTTLSLRHLAEERLTFEPFAYGQQGAAFDLSLTIFQMEDGLSADFRYNSDLFDEATISRMAQHFLTVLGSIVNDPDQYIREIPLLSEYERHTLLLEWNRTQCDHQGRRPWCPQDLCLHPLFEQQVELTPDAIAVVFEDTSLTYRELNDQANHLAHHLLGEGVGPDVLVGVCMEPSLELVVALLAVLKAGGAYVPLDPLLPQERFTFLLEDAQVPVVLTQNYRRQSSIGYGDQLPPMTVKTICLASGISASHLEHRDNPKLRVQPENLAYMIYTSGSTGKPKGVMNTHRGICNHLCWMQQTYQLTPKDRILQKKPFSFDVSVWEVFLPLITGASLIVVRPGGHQDPAYLKVLIAEQQVTMLHFVPSVLQAFLVELNLQSCGSLRQVMCGGETLSAELQARIFAHVPEEVQLHNLYGPTEAAIDVTSWQCQRENVDSRVPIGRPIANTQIYLLDRHLQPVPVGVLAELCISGVNLARGYWNRADLTAERFVPHPFVGVGKELVPLPTPTAPLPQEGARLYRTGDLARYRADGSIEYLGRIDQQVKLRGFRIELGEIEAVLQTHPAVQEAVVVLREEDTVGQYLAAYVVAQRSDLPHLQEELQSHLCKQLPDYMMPATFVYLESLPLTHNGKMNRKALPVPARIAQSSRGYVAPQSELEQRLSGIWQDALSLAQVGIYDNFFDLGGHSLLLIQIQSKLEAYLGYEVPVVDLFQYPTIHTLCTHLSERREPHMLQPITERVRKRKEEWVTNAEGIAIVGVAGRFPGARDMDEFWQNLCHGVESVSFFTEEELLVSGVEPDLIHDPRYVKARGILDDVESFDAAFFGYSPKEAAMMDPQQRLFLECAWEVLEQAGCNPDIYEGLIGVYAGQSESSYLLSNLLPNRAFLAETGTFSPLINNEKDHLATRTCYKLNLKGPGITIQTACSTSLVAVHMACQGLLRYECDMALAGGASIRVPQKMGYLYEEESILSSDGHCRAFDAEARGTVSGNGVGIVALKRLSDAMTSGDTIYAVIRGSAINNDGAAKVGYTAPSVEGQVKVIAEAMAMAGVEPESISYVETHGTGTALGDPIEIAALTQAFRASGQALGKGASPLPTPTPACAIGSLKTNLGHLDAAAGVAGLIKTVLALKYGMIPPSLHFHHPNPKIDFAGSPFYVNTHLTAWEPGNVPRRAGVSSFGIGGTNAHVILEEPPPISLRRDSALSLSGSHEKPHLIVLSAKTASALETMTEQLATYVKSHPDVHLADMAYTLQMGRKSFPHRRAFVARSRTDMLHLLTTLDPESVFTGLVSPETKQVAFLFPGQGPQYVNMGRELYEQEPTFRQQVDTCAEWLVPHLHCDLREIIYPPVGQEAIAQDQLDRMSLAQPAIFVIEYALAQFWMQRGLRPAAMIGHCIGEYVAACLAGVLSLEDALLLVALRGWLMDQLPSGGMLAVSLSEEKLRPKLSARLSFAAHNSTTDCVVSGPTDAIESLEQSLREQGITCRLLRVSRASHSQMVEPVLEQFTNAVKKCHLHSPRLSYVSNVTGKWISEQEATDTGYWARHWRQTVRFAEGMRLLLDSPNMVLLEVGPGHSLSTLAQRTGASPVPTDRTILSSLRHPQTPVSDRAFLLNTCGRLWCAGVVIDWSQFYVGEQQRRIPLPTYPFERQRYWISPVEAGQRQGTAPTASGDRPEENALWQLHKEPDLARWFSVPSWKRSPLAAVQVLPLRGGRVPDQEPGPLPTPTAPACKSCWLIFTDSIGLGTHLRKHLVEKELVPFQETVITVRVGTQFHSHRDCPNGWEYTIRPDSREDYDTLLNDISSCGMFPAHIVHMWTVIATDHIQSGLDYFETAQALGFYSLLFLTQALSEQKGEQPQEIAIITNNLQEVMGGEVLCPARATALGVGKVAPHEYPHITYRSIDIVLPMTIGQGQADRDKPLSLRVPMTPMESAWDQLVDQIIAELRWRSSDVIVAYRGPHRWVQCIEPMQLPPVAEEKLPFKQQGVYLITGGLGGIGLTMAEYLASQVRARLVLTGRTALPAREEWGHRLAILSEQDAVANKIHQIKRLEELGAEVLVIEADVTDLEQMQAVIRQVGEHFGDLHGVIHTAGTPGGGLIQLKTSEVAAGVLAPKVKGTLVLEAVLKDMQPDFLILCSSLSALIGEPGQVDYCAANTFLDSFAFYHTVQKRVKTISIDWDTWQEVGMAVNALKPYKKALKYNTEIQQRLRNGILPQEGVEVFRRILINRDISQVIVSTDGILARLEQVKSLLEEGDVGSRAGESPAVRSRQGKVSVDKPGDRSDDLVSPSLDQRPNLQTPYVPPQNETQQQIAAIWQKLLGIEKIGIHDNFVDLGGHSLLGTQLITRLRDTFQIDVSLRTLFGEPTVARLALVIVQRKAELVDDTLLLQAIEDLENLTDDEVQTLLAVDAKQTGKVQKI